MALLPHGTHHPSSWDPLPPPPRGSLPPPLALTLCPAPFPQGFPPSQPGGRESRSTDSPLSPRPAQSKVGTGLGARRSRAHLSPGPRRSRGLLLPTGMLPTPGLGTLCHGHPHHLLSWHSILQPPAWRLHSPSLTNSFLLGRARVPCGGHCQGRWLSLTTGFAWLWKWGNVLGKASGIRMVQRRMPRQCERCVLVGSIKLIAEQLLRPAPEGAGVIPEGKRAQEGDSVPSFWGHPVPSLP